MRRTLNGHVSTEQGCVQFASVKKHFDNMSGLKAE